MIPMLYQFNSRTNSAKIIPEDANLNFKNQSGLRLVDCISCKVTEQERGIYDLEMVYPIDGQYYNAITPGDVIISSHDRRIDNNQGFIIYKMSRPINGRITIYAHHVSYILNEMIATGVQDGDAMVYLWSGLHTDSQGMFYFKAQQSPYDATAVTMSDASTELGIHSIKEILYGIEGGFLDKNFGDYIFDNNTVYHYEDGGKLLNYWLQYGINIIDFKQELNADGNTWNAVKGYWKGTDDNQNTVYVESAIDYPFIPPSQQGELLRCKIIDMSSSFDTAPTIPKLQTAVHSWAVKHYKNDNDAAVSSIDVKFVDLKRLANFDDMSWQLDDIRLCDRINISFTPYNVSTSMKVNKIVWDVLKEDFISISLGEPKETIVETIRQVARG